MSWGLERTIMRKIRILIMKHAPYHGLLKLVIIGVYTCALCVAGKYKKKKNDIHEAILENRPELISNRKDYKKVFRDVMYCCFLYQNLPQEYFSYKFDMLSHEGRCTFVTCGNKKPYYKVFNNPNYADFLDKKTETFRKYGEFYGRDVLAIVDETDFDGFNKFAEKHPQFIYKPAQDAGGKGIKIYDISMFNSIRELFDEIASDGACVVEELIKQHETLSKIHRGSVNTVRYVTFRTESGEVIPQWTFLRMGSGDSITDNASGGGISAKIDADTGIVCDYGRDYKRNKYMFHPDSGVQLVGFQLPEWDKLKALACKCAAVMPELRFVGWDFAYSEKGWIMVEGNARTQCVAPQITEYGGLFYTYKNMMEKYKEGIEMQHDRKE